MFGGSKAVIGLDVGSYAVKAVALQANRDRITLQGYAQARIDSQDVGDVIRRVIDQLGVKPKRVVTSVSGRSVIVRQVETPKLPENELKAHISVEADRYIPFGTEEVIIDCQAMPPRVGAPEGTQQVMLVAVRKGFIQEHLAGLKAAGIVPEIVDVDVFAVSNAYEVLGPPIPTVTDRKAVAVVDIGASKSNITIIQSDRVLFTREVYLAGNEISDAIGRTLNFQAEDVDRMKLAPGDALESIIDAAMPAFEDMANEIRLSFDYVEGQFETEVASVVLTGGSSQLPNVAGILGNILGRPVHVFDPLAGLDLVPSKYDIHGLDANSPGLTVALGLAIHLLEKPGKSLGGQQSHNWQPRARGLDLVSTGAPSTEQLPTVSDSTLERAQAAYAPGAVTEPMYDGNDTGVTEAPPAYQRNDQAAITFPAPAPAAAPKPGTTSFSSLEQDGDDQLDPIDVSILESGGNKVIPETRSHRDHQSGILVVLDDEEPNDRASGIQVSPDPAKAATGSQTRFITDDDLINERISGVTVAPATSSTTNKAATTTGGQTRYITVDDLDEERMSGVTVSPATSSTTKPAISTGKLIAPGFHDDDEAEPGEISAIRLPQLPDLPSLKKK